MTREHGLHARPAGQLSNIAKEFDSDIKISVIESKDTENISSINRQIDDVCSTAGGSIPSAANVSGGINVKDNIFGMMRLGIKQGDSILISCEGKDEKNACNALEDFCHNNFSTINL